MNKRAATRKKTIIDAAIQVFSSKGYHNTRMEEIATIAGIGKGTIYEYFDSKLQLFQEMLESSLQSYYETLDAGNKENMSFEERVYLLFEAHLIFCREQKQLTRIIFWDTEIFDEELKDWTIKIRKEKEEKLIAIVQEGINRGEIRDVGARLVSQIIIGSLGSIWVPITLEGWEVDPAHLARQLTEILMNGIRN
jgi:AcrR family transcriptional regulator